MMPATCYADNKLWQLIQCRLHAAEPDETGKLRKRGAFLRNVHGMLIQRENMARQEQEEGRREGEAPRAILSMTKPFADKIADCLVDFMWEAGRSGSTGMDSWNGWLGIRGATIEQRGRTDDEHLTSWIERKLDRLIWDRVKILKVHTMLPVQMAFLSYYLRMEGMKNQPLVSPNKEQAPATYRRRMRLHRMVRRLCVLHLRPTLDRCPDTREHLEQDGMRIINEGKTLTRSSPVIWGLDRG